MAELTGVDPGVDPITEEVVNEIIEPKVNTIASLSCIIKELASIIQIANPNNTGLTLDLENLKQRL